MEKKSNQLIIKQLVGTFIFYLIIFISAGRINYWQGWVYAAAGVLMTIIGLSLLRADPELMDERSKPGEGVKQWDKKLMGLSLLVLIAMYITAGLDSGRFKWSPRFHWSFYLAGIVLTVAGQLLFIIAQQQNKFFSSLVRIQTDRGHTVVDTGLYKAVRHPAYLGNIIQTIGFPLLMGSVWSMMPALVLILIALIRTGLEDRTLINELSGYREYANKTRYRIIPYIW